MICQTLKIAYLYKPSLEINWRIAFIVITIHGKLTRATFLIKKSFKIGAVLNKLVQNSFEASYFREKSAGFTITRDTFW